MLDNVSGCYHELMVAEKIFKKGCKNHKCLREKNHHVLAEDYFPQFLKRSDYDDYFYGGIYQKLPFCRK